jgi:hypothetical protein
MNKVLTALAGACLAISALAIALPAHAQMYWRLDTGWSRADSDLAITKCSICIPSRVDKIRDSYIVGGGVGYRLNAAVRGDVTLGYRGNYSIHTSGSEPFTGGVSSTVLLANGYYDFSAGGWTPYVGLGVGRARNKMDPLVQLNEGGGITFSNVSTTVPGGTKNSAAFALMAGVGIPVSGLIFDIGYRYVNLGKVRSDPGVVTQTFRGTTFGSPGVISTSTTPYSGAEGKLTAHEVFVGIRF